MAHVDLLVGLYRPQGWQRRLPLYVSTVYAGTVWYREVCGLAVGLFGRCVYVAVDRRGA